MTLKMQPKTIFFDFDGVLLDTLEAKGRAIAKPFAVHGESIQKKVYDYHLNNGGMNRKLKVQTCYKLFIGSMMPESLLESWLAEINREMSRELFLCVPVKGVLDFMQKHKNSSGLAWIVSAAPQEEIKALSLHFGFAEQVKEIFGYPNKKSEVIAHLIKTNHLNRQECLMIGDASEDLKAANENQIPFLLRKTPYSTFAAQYPGKSIPDFTEASETILQL